MAKGKGGFNLHDTSTANKAPSPGEDSHGHLGVPAHPGTNTMNDDAVRGTAARNPSGGR